MPSSTTKALRIQTSVGHTWLFSLLPIDCYNIIIIIIVLNISVFCTVLSCFIVPAQSCLLVIYTERTSNIFLRYDWASNSYHSVDYIYISVTYLSLNIFPLSSAQPRSRHLFDVYFCLSPVLVVGCFFLSCLLSRFLVFTAWPPINSIATSAVVTSVSLVFFSLLLCLLITKSM